MDYILSKQIDQVRQTMAADVEAFGLPDAPTQRGFLEIAQAGAAVWNAWFHDAPPLETPDFSHLNSEENYIHFAGFIFQKPETQSTCAIFSNAHFHDSAAQFKGARFEGDVDFENAHFHDFALFTQASFKGTSIFRKCHFLRGADFETAAFSRATTFSDCRFHGPACFPSTQFGGNANFSGAHFFDQCIFNRSNFPWGASFLSTRFYDDASFDSAIFKNAQFTEARFGDFDFVTKKQIEPPPHKILRFPTKTSFKGTRFDGDADFTRAKFESDADFSASFSAPPDKAGDSFQKVYFQGATFKGKVDFRGREFKSTTDFGRSRASTEGFPRDDFYFQYASSQNTLFRYPPEFHGCKFHQDTSFDSVEFPISSGPRAARAYRTLKLAMEQLKATREEQRFFVLEARAEHRSLMFWPRLMSSIYAKTSDYGFSLLRPIVALGLTTLFMAFLHGWMTNLHAGHEGWKAWIFTSPEADIARTWQWLRYVAINTLPVPGFDKTQMELRDALFGKDGAIVSIAMGLEMIHKVISLGCVFLLGLALRNLFKMKS